jgi:hypothetical protein
MADKKNSSPPPDYEAAIYKKEYAPGIVAILRRLSRLNEKTFLEMEKMSDQLGNSPVEDFEQRLSILLSENLKQVVKEVFALGGLSQLSLEAFRESAGYPLEVTR